MIYSMQDFHARKRLNTSTENRGTLEPLEFKASIATTAEINVTWSMQEKIALNYILYHNIFNEEPH